MSDALLDQVQKLLDAAKKYESYENHTDALGYAGGSAFGAAAGGALAGGGSFGLGAAAGLAAGAAGGYGLAHGVVGGQYHRDIGDSLRQLSRMAGYLEKRRKDREAGVETGVLDRQSLSEGYEGLDDLRNTHSSRFKRQGYDYWSMSRKLADELRRKSDYELYDELARGGDAPKGLYIPGGPDNPVQAPSSRAPSGFESGKSPEAPEEPRFGEAPGQYRSQKPSGGPSTRYLTNPRPAGTFSSDDPSVPPKAETEAPSAPFSQFQNDQPPKRSDAPGRRSDASHRSGADSLDASLRKVRSERYRKDPNYQRRIAMEIGRHASITPLFEG